MADLVAHWEHDFGRLPAGSHEKISFEMRVPCQERVVEADFVQAIV